MNAQMKKQSPRYGVNPGPLLAASLIWAALFPACNTASQEPTPAEPLAQRDYAPDDVHEHGFARYELLPTLTQDAPIFQQNQSFIITPEQPVAQVGLMLTSSSADVTQPLRWRARGLDGLWTDWFTAEITWQEDTLMVGRILLAAPAQEIEIEAVQPLEHAQIELFDTLRARQHTLTRDLPFASEPSSSPLLTNTQALAPADLVTPRADWGARNPEKICGDVVTPYRVSVHHTAQPDSDGGDPAARMRQMQAYHIDSNGWCDIGYHFVVSQSGQIYQGRSDERRPGAHVGGQNAGNIGVSFIGDYQSNQPQQTQLNAGKKILDWIRTEYNIAWDRDHVKGHREWPGQNTNCPGDNLLNRLSDLMAGGGTPTDPGSDAPVEVEANLLMSNTLQDMLTQGSSRALLDALPGTTFQAELVITNNSSEPIRNVMLGYSIEEPFIQSSSYVIQSDAPLKDRTTWMTNDADAAEENPAKDAFGASGELVMYAFAAGETKRVLVDLEAHQYSLGSTDHPDIRTWIKHIDDLYEGQDEWDQTPALNNTGSSDLLQASSEIDIPSPQQWLFDAGEAEQAEGWQDCSSIIKPLNVDTELSALLLPLSEGCITAPSWTAIDASTFDTFILRAAKNDAATTLKITWSANQDLSSSSNIYVDISSLASEKDIVIPMSEQPTWTGTIKALKIEALTKESTPSDMLAIDSIFFQEGQGRTTSSNIEIYIDAPYVVVKKDPPSFYIPNTNGDPGTEEPDHEQNPSNPSNDPSTPMLDDDGEGVTVNDGCSVSSPQSNPSSPASALLLLLGGLFFGRRLRSKRKDT